MARTGTKDYQAIDIQICEAFDPAEYRNTQEAIQESQTAAERLKWKRTAKKLYGCEKKQLPKQNARLQGDGGSATHNKRF